MHQISEAELDTKISNFLTRKMTGYIPVAHRPHEERARDSRKSLMTKLSEQYTLLVGNQPVLHR